VFVFLLFGFLLLIYKVLICYCLGYAEMACAEQTAPKSTGGKAPRKQLATKVFFLLHDYLH
jgi:hypothetical protein